MSSSQVLLSFRISQLPRNVTEGSISKRVAKMLDDGAVVVSIATHPVQSGGNTQQAIIQVETSLTAEEATLKLRSASISHRRRRIQYLPNGPISDEDDIGNNSNNGSNGGAKESKDTDRSDNRNGSNRKNTKRPISEARAQRRVEHKIKESELRTDGEDLASCFHLHVNGNDEVLQRVVDREEMSVVFQAFLKGISSTERTANECRRLEAHVMSHLRQQRLLRSKRAEETMLMTLARLGGPGDFPTEKIIESEQASVMARKITEQENKMGVEVSEPSFHDLVVAVKESAKLPFVITTKDPSNPTNVVLTDVTIGGAKRNAFTIDNIALPSILMEGDTSNTICQLLFQPSRIGVYRCMLRLTFESNNSPVGGNKSFQIVRHVKVRAGDRKLEELLKPVAPYEGKKKGSSHEFRTTRVVNPPRQPTDENRGANANDPFNKMPSYKIPLEIRKLIISNDLENILEKPEINLDGYSEFWKNLLWVSELQTHQDIKVFDLEQIHLKKEGNLMSFLVPGLAEGRPSVLRGDMVSIMWNKKLYRGRVHSTRQLDVLVELHDSFYSTYDPVLDAVDIRFTLSRTTYRTSHDGITSAPERMGQAMLLPGFEHVEECLAAGRGRPVPESLAFANRELNVEQQSCVVNIIRGACRPLPSIIWGPPGTGKSTTIVETVYQLSRLESKPHILVVAPSNDATDLLVEKLSPYFPPTEMRRLLAFTRSLDQLDSTVKAYAKEGLVGEEVIQEAMSAQITVCTVTFAARLATYGVPFGHFDVLCVDEAGHATEPEVIAVASTLIDFQRNDDSVGQLVLAGDPRQLGPIITSSLCRKFGMELSYMERIANFPAYGKDSSDQLPAALITKLLHNYRSHPAILKLPNDLFYDGELIAAGNILKTHDMTRWEHLTNNDFPLLFCATHGENMREGNSPSWFNPQEAQEVVNYVDILVNQSRPPVAQSDIGIITPYARQAQKIRLALASRNLNDIKVGSVESFQGQERRCIIVSTVRTDTELIAADLKYNLGFVANSKRFNVAVTRASSLLVVIGDPNVLAADKKNWLPFLQYCKEHNAWAGEDWEYTGDKVVEESVAAKDNAEAGPSAKAAQEGVDCIKREE